MSKAASTLIQLQNFAFSLQAIKETMEAWTAGLLFACLSSVWFLVLTSFRSRKTKNGSLGLPPGPWGLPLLGHLHMLGDLPHQNLTKLAKKYGPIMSIRLGLIPAVVVSSPKYAELFLKTHDLVFASRPKIQVAELLSYGQKNLAFAQYGPYWRNMRRLCTTELLSSSKVELFKPVRKEELGIFVESLKSATGEIDLSDKIESLIEDITYRMVFGVKEDRFNLKEGIQSGVRLAGLFNIADFIPYLRSFDLQGFGPRMKSIFELLDGPLEKIVDEHVQQAKELQGQPRDFVDVMLSLMETNNTRELHLDRGHVKAIVLDMLAAAMDTSSTTIEWVIAELLKNPHVMKLVQKELENIVGLDRMVEEADLVKLDYLNAAIKESMRIHPVAPLLIPHESTEDITVNGYFIPKGSRVLINSWAIGRDTNVWSDNAEEFFPERFIGSNIDVHGHDFKFLPFGSGRRKCPGMQLGMTGVQLVIAQLVHCFNLQLPDGMSPDDLDMTEKFGLTLPRANHLRAIPTYRLQI